MSAQGAVSYAKAAPIALAAYGRPYVWIVVNFCFAIYTTGTI